MSNIEKAVSLTNYFVSLPRVSYLLVAMLLLSLFLGLGISLVTSVPIPETIPTAIFVLAIPGFLAIVLGKALMPRVPLKRLAATALAGAVIFSLSYLSAVSLKHFSTPISGEVIFAGAAIVFVTWYIIARIVFVHKWRSLLFAILQLFLQAAFLIMDGFLPMGADPINVLIKFYLSSFVLLGAIYIFFLLINAPMKRTFGVASTDAVSMFFSQWFYNKKDIENAFRKVGETVTTYLSLFLFRRKDGDYALIVPCIHFGPFGNLGGSNFSYLIAQELGKKHNLKSMVFHGSATHDLNPVSATELKKVVDACSSILQDAEPGPTSVSFCASKGTDAIAEALVFSKNKSAFIGLSRAPRTTEDISLGMGMALSSRAERKLDSATIADEHNAETGEIKYVEPGTKMGFEYMDALDSAIGSKQNPRKLKAGFAFGASDSPKIGPAGIKVAVFGTLPHYAIILIDSNGVTPAFRRKIMNSVESLFRAKGWGEVVAAVYTTDTHKVNSVKGVVNPLTDDSILLEQVASLAEGAKEDMREAKFDSRKVTFDIRALGAKQAIEIISTVNAIVAISKVAAPILIISGIIAILWLMYRLG
jgi:putative membrane protein